MNKNSKERELLECTLDHVAVPVVAGLVVGVCLVLLFAAISLSSFSSSGQNGFSTDKRNQFTLTLEGLKDHYLVGEKLDFALGIKGYGQECGTPNILIVNVKSGTTIYELYKHGSWSCTPSLNIVDETWTLKDLNALTSLTITEAGNYKVTGTYHGSETIKNIEVN